MIVQRCSENPIIDASQVNPTHPDFEVAGVFNPAATIYQNEIILLMRVAERCVEESGWVKIPVARFGEGGNRIEEKKWKLEDHQCDLSDTRAYQIDGQVYLSSLSHLHIARSRDGIHFTTDDQPFMLPSRPDEAFGVEDARICMIDDVYHITYTAVSDNGFGVALATTTDWSSFEHHGMILPPQNKNAVLFPQKINNRYLIFHRPLVEFLGQSSIWMAESENKIHWGNHRCLMTPRNNTWEGQKIGIGPEPLLTEEGWLVLYHGCGKTAAYTLQLALLDRNDPTHVLARTEYPILKPELPYEKEGFFPNVVFSNGWIHFDDGHVLIYYGAADAAIGLAETTVDNLLRLLLM